MKVGCRELGRHPQYKGRGGLFFQGARWPAGRTNCVWTRTGHNRRAACSRYSKGYRQPWEKGKEPYRTTQARFCSRGDAMPGTDHMLSDKCFTGNNKKNCFVGLSLCSEMHRVAILWLHSKGQKAERPRSVAPTPGTTLTCSPCVDLPRYPESRPPSQGPQAPSLRWVFHLH